MLSIQPLALPGAKHVLNSSHRHQRPGLAVLPVRARKQTEKQDVDADLVSDVLPADLQKLSKLAKTELQHELEVRGLDKDGNKEELANRLLDTLIAQESVLSVKPPDRVKLQQQLEQPAAAAPTRRGRRTSRKATASADPQPEPVLTPQAADPVIAAAAATAEVVEAPAATSRRGRKTSRKVTSSSDPLPSPADIIAAAAGDSGPDVKPTRRGRKTSRKATTSADPLEIPAQDSVAAAAEASATAAVEGAAEASTAEVPSKRGRRSKTTAVDPSPAAAEQSAPAKAGRARRTSRKSSVLEPETIDAAPTAASVEAPARQRGRRTSSTKTASKAPTAAADAPAAASGPTEAVSGTPPVSRAKLLAQQLAKKEIAVHGMGATAAAASGAAAAAAPGSAWVGADQLLYGGSQAQSDSLVMGGDNGMQAVGAESTFSVDNGSMDEVFAQLTAERAAGLADEAQLRPEATLSGFDAMTLPPSAGAADAAASWGGAAAAAAVEVDGQHPSLIDCVAAVEEPLTASAAAVEVDEAADAAMSAFDQMYVHIASPAAAEADLQHPNLSDCVAAVEEPLLTKAEAVVLDEAPDAAMAAFDHVGLDTPGAAAVASGNQSPSLQDIALAVEPSFLPASLDESLGAADEAPDAAMAAFDHVGLDTPGAAAVASGNQSPSLQDIALAVEPSALPDSLDESVGEDEEPDMTLAAFDHIVLDAPRSETAAATAATAAPAAVKCADEGAAAAGYDQAYLDPSQPSALDASVGSGSVDLGGAEAEVVVVTAAAAATGAKAAAAAAAAAPVKQQQQPQQKQGGQEGVDFSVVMQRWWSSVMQMFEDWQKNLSGPK